MPPRILLRDPHTLAPRPLPVADFRPEALGPAMVWIDLEAPTVADVAWLETLFHFHPLTLEDCLKRGQRPKIESYEGYMFLDVYSAAFEPRRCRLQLHEIDIFLGEGYLITSHLDPLPVLDQVLERWRHDAAGGADHLLYLLLDTVVDTYFPIVDELEDQLERIEERLFISFRQQLMGEIFNLRKQLVLFRKVIAPTRDVCLMLARRETPIVQGATALYLQDVYDHLIRVTDSIDTFRDLVSGSLEAYMSVVANRTNDTMKRLTTISAILMTVALIPSVYGMNFARMPELAWTWGYEWALGLMLGVALVLTLWFKLIRYF